MKNPLRALSKKRPPGDDDHEFAGIESFSPIRQYVIAGVLIVLAALVAVNWVSNRGERGVLISRLEDESINPAEVATFSVVEQMSVRSGAAPGTDPLLELDWMDRTVLNAVVGQPVSRVDIVSASGEIVFSTDHSQIGRMHSAVLELGLPLQASARYLEAVQVRGLDGRLESLDVVETWVPVFREASAGRMGDPQSLFVVYRDVTSSVANAMTASGRFRVMTLVGVMSVMFAALLLVVSRGHTFARQARSRLEEMLARQQSLTAQLDASNTDLRAAIEAKNRFLSVVTHELNTPLASIVAFADILKKNRLNTLSKRDLKHVEAISRSGNEMGILIRDLLDLSRIEAGTMRMEFVEFDLVASVRDVVEGMTPIANDRSQQLLTDLPQSLLQITADSHRVQQVVKNVLSNASKYSPTGSHIWLKVFQHQDSVTIEVRDEGIGISHEDQEQLFTPFFRASNEETRKMPGTGLGLVICRQIAELHDGTFELESEHGKGTTVRLTLPCCNVVSTPQEGAA